MENSQQRSASIAVTGSLAYDLIMDYHGYFKDHILPDKLHVINLSFLVGELKKQRGGCAANIAYTLALLGHTPRIVAAAGNDFGEYEQWLRARHVDTSGIHIFPELTTATCYITTDQAHNQITGFYPGAMSKAREISLHQSIERDCRWVVVAPDDPPAMLRHCAEAKKHGLRLVLDLSWQVTAMDGPGLREAAHGAHALIFNDYEFGVFQEKTGRHAKQLLADDIEMLVVTMGSDGSEISTRDGVIQRAPAAQVSNVVDATGAGDAYRGGFMAGLLQNQDLSVCGRMGSVAAAYCIENYGTQNHAYTREQFERRYQENFGAILAPT
ncbi:MAG TPA: carbohydrate kinase family protein [Candidatus Xenobia bacterium]